MDSYVLADKELIDLLNFDYCFAPELLHAVAKLHTSSIVCINDEILFILTVEVYARSKGTDVHAETSNKSLPLNSSSLFVGICEEADGGNTKDKLKIGGLSMNVLSTMPAMIGSKPTVILNLNQRLTNPDEGCQAKAV